jgi:hypothetical protein
LAVPIGLFAGSLGVNSAAPAGLLPVTQTEAHTMTTAAAMQIAAGT